METRLWLRTCNLYQFEKYIFWRILAKFLKINCNRKKVEMLSTDIWETCSINQRHETERLKYTRTEENVTTVDKMVSLLNHKGQKQTHCSICQISKERDLTMCSIIQIIHCILVRSVFCLPTCLLSIIVSFSCIYISQGSVATQLKCGRIYNNHFSIIIHRMHQWKNFENRLIIGKDMENHKMWRFLGQSV